MKERVEIDCKQPFFVTMTTKKTFEMTLEAVCIIGVSLFLWQHFYLRVNTFTDSEMNHVDTYQALQNSNPFFARATDLKKLGDLVTAREQYTKALSIIKDPVQEGQIQSELAVIAQETGEYAKAIVSYKDIAAHDTYTNGVRAYAVENMATLLLSPSAAEYRPLVFSGYPYEAMASDASDPIALRRLYEYAASFQPMARSEYMIARWYTTELFRDDLATSTRDAYLQLVYDNLALGDEALQRMSLHDNEKAALPEALLDRAILTGQMAFLGEKSMAEADRAFADAMSPATHAGSDDGYVEYAYALFLLDAGSSRIVDLHTVLATYRSPAYAQAPILEFFRAARENAAGNKSELQALAAQDDSFKKLLVSLGWMPTDFVQDATTQ